MSVGEMGATELAGVSRIARNVICPLADKGISVLVLSTYQSDYILVSLFCYIFLLFILGLFTTRVGKCKKELVTC